MQYCISKYILLHVTLFCKKKLYGTDFQNRTVVSIFLDFIIVDAVGGWTSETIPNITNVMIHLADIISNLKTRLVVVGGAGSLFVNKERTITVDMGKDFPDDWKPLSSAHSKGLKYLMASQNLNWTYISPACDFVSDGIKTNEYQIGGEDLLLNSKGLSTISYADYVIALVDVIISNKYNKEHISVVSK